MSSKAPTHTRDGVVATTIGFVALIIGASGVLADADFLNLIWELNRSPGVVSGDLSRTAFFPLASFSSWDFCS
jgi:hypothetical protein